MNELALFAGAGGGILGGHLLGWRCVCAVEWEPYPTGVLIARQNEGILPPFPIWDDVRSFDGRPWRGIVDVVSGGFPVRIYQPLVVALASTENEAASGRKWHGSLAKYDPDTCSWRTVQYSLHGDLEEFSETWPRWGTMRNGECSVRSIPADLLNVNASGLWPAPVKGDGFAGFSTKCMERKERGETRPSGAKIGTCLRWFRPVLPYVVNGKINPILHQWLMNWPLGWTSLDVRVTDRFQQWCALHGIPSTTELPSGETEAA